MPAVVGGGLLVYSLTGEEPAAVTEVPFDLPQAESPQPEKPQVELIPETVMIDLKGQVAAPGVYELPAGSRMTDAIDAAGGLLEGAESRAINLAMKLQDEMTVYIPKVGEEAVDLPTVEAVSTPGAAASEGLININTATAADLEQLPGIGPSKAAAIIAHREENGDFPAVESLTDVTGIGDKTFEALKDSITTK